MPGFKLAYNVREKPGFYLLVGSTNEAFERRPNSFNMVGRTKVGDGVVTGDVFIAKKASMPR